METLLLFNDRCLEPLLRLAYVPLDWLLGWLGRLPAAAALLVAGALTGLVINLLLKFLGDQELLRRCRADLRRLRELRAADRRAGDREALARRTALARSISGRYLGQSCLAALWTVLPVLVLTLWTGDRLGLRPLRPGDEVELRAAFAAGAEGFAHLVPNEGLAPVGPPIAAVEEAEAAADGVGWRLRVKGEGDWPLVLRHAGRTYTVELPVRAAGGRPPAALTRFGRDESGDGLLTLGLGLEPSLAAAWWNLRLGWLGLYALAALAAGVGFRRLLRVQ